MIHNFLEASTHKHYIIRKHTPLQPSITKEKASAKKHAIEFNFANENRFRPSLFQFKAFYKRCVGCHDNKWKKFACPNLDLFRQARANHSIQHFVMFSVIQRNH